MSGLNTSVLLYTNNNITPRKSIQYREKKIQYNQYDNSKWRSKVMDSSSIPFLMVINEDRTNMKQKA
ncbi:hypothetical protein DICVIV_08273 [Dictyocaulus viviparus]|uniref:Uncharacterized protein n=1 Tax=Dictyocaulus viviparus TaxID=29172 RepID=A0A0D8XME8_DICVI|nr:hypothetical protein DICVIV_08273 [Dictyocaulus viviparus]